MATKAVKYLYLVARLATLDFIASEGAAGDHAHKELMELNRLS